MTDSQMSIEELEKKVDQLNRENLALRKQLVFSDSLLDHIPSPIFYKDTQFRYIGCNRAFMDFLGFSREEIIGKTAHELTPRHQADHYQEVDKQLIASPGELFYDTVIHHADGSDRDVVIHKATFANPDGSLAGIVGVIVDVTERKEAERKLLQSEEKYRHLFEKSKDGIVRTTIDGRILECNQTYCDMLDYTEDQLQKLTYQEITDLKWQEIERKVTEEQIIKRGYTDHYEKEYIRKDGQRVPVSVRAWMARDEDGVPSELWGILRDITKQKQAEMELDKILEDLKRSNTELEQFAYIASHDLQEPLRKIISFGERLVSRAGENLDVRSRDYLQRMTNAADRMQNLINSLLHYSRVTTRGKDFHPVRLDRVIEEVLEDIEVKIQRTKATIEVDSMPMVQADKIQMRQLFQNLISNAVKFARENVPPVVQIQCKTLDEQFYKITVRDNGIGFEKEYAEKIFIPFKKLHSRSEYEGTGIGLSICDKIVKRHGGTITAHSIPGEGSTFTIILPQPRENPDQEKQQEQQDKK